MALVRLTKQQGLQTYIKSQQNQHNKECLALKTRWFKPLLPVKTVGLLVGTSPSWPCAKSEMPRVAESPRMDANVKEPRNPNPKLLQISSLLNGL